MSDPTLTHALVTGACGFLGRALCARLLAQGVRVVAVDLAECFEPPLDGLCYRHGSVASPEALQRIFGTFARQSAGDGCVFHLAAQGHVGACHRNPAEAGALNVTGTLNVLEACRHAGLRRIVFPSTSLVYGVPKQLPLRETDPTSPTSVYAATKLAGEALLQGYAAAYPFACGIARLGSVYGQTGEIDAVISILLRQARAGGPLKIRSCRSSRDFIYRDDAAEGLIHIARVTREPGCGVFNVSSGHATHISDLARTICEVTKIAPVVIETQPQYVDFVPAVELSIERICAATPWRPAWSLEAGLRQTLTEMERDR